MSRLLWITPAYRRPEITRVCLSQRAETMRELARIGIEADCVVISGDGENLETARGLGFPTIERSENVLGSKFNDGYQYAVEHGYDWAAPLGTDQIVDPQVYTPLLGLPTGLVLATRWFTAVKSDGRHCLQFRHPIYLMKIWPVSAIARAGGRPCAEAIMNGCDGSAHERIFAANPGLRMAFYELDPLECVQFESGQTQVTSWQGYETLAARVENGNAFPSPIPWRAIAARYGQDTIDRAYRYYRSGRSRLA